MLDSDVVNEYLANANSFLTTDFPPPAGVLARSALAAIPGETRPWPASARPARSSAPTPTQPRSTLLPPNTSRHLARRATNSAGGRCGPRPPRRSTTAGATSGVRSRGFRLGRGGTRLPGVGLIRCPSGRRCKCRRALSCASDRGRAADR